MRSTRFLHHVIAAAIGSALSIATGSLATTQSAPEAYRETIPGTLVTFELVSIPQGTVDVNGTPVAVKPFQIGRTEVTWDMYDVFALGLDVPKEKTGADASARPSQPYGAPDYGWGHAGFPAISVTRDAAEAFCTWLSAKTGRTYRLPTEAEWLHAASLAGSGMSPAQREAIAWHKGNSSARAHAVGTRKPDALGLFDLFGNAAEWVATPDGARVTRGGSFRDAVVGPSARAVQDDSWNERDPQLPKSRWWLSDGPFAGFRIVRNP